MPHSLVTATINVGGYGFERRAQVAKAAFSFYPHVDVVGFQEMTPEILPAFEQHGLNFRLGEPAGNFCNAIAINPKTLEWLDSGTLHLTEDGKPGPGYGAETERSVHWAEVLHGASGRRIVFLNTQLDNKCAYARWASGLKILDFLSSRHGMDLAIVSGDFNMNVQGVTDPAKLATYGNMLNAGFIDAYLEAEPKRVGRERTFHHFQGPFTCGDDPYGSNDLDYVFVRGEKVRVDNCMVDLFNAGGTWPSDHLWVVTDLKLLD